MAEKQNNKWIIITFAVNFCLTLTTLYLVGIMFWVGLYKFNPMGQVGTAQKQPAQCVTIPTALPQIQAQSQPTNASEPVSQKTINVNDTGFVIKVFSENAGDNPVVTVVNSGAASHSFVIDELKVDSGDIAAGKSKDIPLGILPDVEKNYTFYSNSSGDDKNTFSGAMMVIKQ
jgi:hypothetical protein